MPRPRCRRPFVSSTACARPRRMTTVGMLLLTLSVIRSSDQASAQSLRLTTAGSDLGAAAEACIENTHAKHDRLALNAVARHDLGALEPVEAITSSGPGEEIWIVYYGGSMEPLGQEVLLPAVRPPIRGSPNPSPRFVEELNSSDLESGGSPLPFGSKYQTYHLRTVPGGYLALARREGASNEIKVSWFDSSQSRWSAPIKVPWSTNALIWMQSSGSHLYAGEILPPHRSWQAELGGSFRPFYTPTPSILGRLDLTNGTQTRAFPIVDFGRYLVMSLASAASGTQILIFLEPSGDFVRCQSLDLPIVFLYTDVTTAHVYATIAGMNNQILVYRWRWIPQQ